MNLEETLLARLAGHCPRVFKPVAPVGTHAPYVTWQHMGGQSLRYFDNALPEKRNSYIQISVWADDSGEAFALLRAIEVTLMQITDGTFTAVPMEEPTDGIDDGERVAGAVQAFSIHGLRV